METPVGFGSALFDNNHNCNFKGTSNRGEIRGNGNTRILAMMSLLNIFKTNNCQFDVTESQLTAESCSNIAVSGKKNKISLESENNLSFKGDHNEVRLRDNSNFKFSGNYGRGSYTGNSNARISGNENRINAEKNNNLKITGSKHNLDVSGTNNHVIETATGSEENYFEPRLFESSSSSQIRSSSFFSFSSTHKQTSCIQYIIKYLNSAAIQGHAYQLGAFEFSVDESVEGPNVRLEIEERTMRADSVEVLELTSKTCLLLARAGSISEKLRIAGTNIRRDESGSGGVKLIIGYAPLAGI